MTTKQMLIIGSIALLGAFACGRWLAPTKVITKTVEVEKKTDDKTVDTNRDKLTTITETDKPDGTKVKTTTISDVTATKLEDKSTDDTLKETSKEVDRDSAKVTVSLLAGVKLSGPSTPVYGLAITKPILGPITVGLFGFQNGTVGGSVGLTF